MSAPDELSQEGFGEFMPRASEGPVVMLNLLEFKPDGGRERYEEYGAAVAPLLEQVGASIVFAGEAATPLIGDDGWDMVVLVSYPTRQAFLEMSSSPAYLEIAHLRTEALSRGELHPLDVADELPTQPGRPPAS